MEKIIPTESKKNLLPYLEKESDLAVEKHLKNYKYICKKSSKNRKIYSGRSDWPEHLKGLFINGVSELV